MLEGAKLVVEHGPHKTATPASDSNRDNLIHSRVPCRHVDKVFLNHPVEGQIAMGAMSIGHSWQSVNDISKRGDFNN
jgi:hypothetical protein